MADLLELRQKTPDSSASRVEEARRAFDAAYHNLRLEGITPTLQERQLLMKFARGEITRDEFFRQVGFPPEA